MANQRENDSSRALAHRRRASKTASACGPGGPNGPAVLSIATNRCKRAGRGTARGTGAPCRCHVRLVAGLFGVRTLSETLLDRPLNSERSIALLLQLTHHPAARLDAQHHDLEDDL